MSTKVKNDQIEEKRLHIREKYCAKFRKKMEDYLNDFNMTQANVFASPQASVYSFRPMCSVNDSDFKYSSTQKERISQSLIDNEGLDVTYNDYKHAYRSREKVKEIQPRMRFTSHNRFERMLENIDTVVKDSSEFDEMLMGLTGKTKTKTKTTPTNQVLPQERLMSQSSYQSSNHNSQFPNFKSKINMKDLSPDKKIFKRNPLAMRSCKEDFIKVAHTMNPLKLNTFIKMA